MWNVYIKTRRRKCAIGDVREKMFWDTRRGRSGTCFSRTEASSAEYVPRDWRTTYRTYGVVRLRKKIPYLPYVIMECAEQVKLYETRYRGTWKRMEHE